MTEKMRDIDHTNPYTNDAFGDAFRRGPDVAADGGERSGGPRSSSGPQPDGSKRDGEEQDDTMDDVDHESPGDGVTRTYERGTEGRDETV